MSYYINYNYDRAMYEVKHDEEVLVYEECKTTAVYMLMGILNEHYQNTDSINEKAKVNKLKHLHHY